MEIVERIKEKILVLMKQRQMSIYELANKSDLTEACIRNWYTKRNYTPSIEALEKIANAFNISIAEFVINDEENLCLVDSDKKKLLNYWSIMSESQKKIFLLQLEMLFDKQ